VPIEIEKKYRLTTEQRAEILKLLPQLGAVRVGDEFEENTQDLQKRPVSSVELLSWQWSQHHNEEESVAPR
jgi:hypothetical protein